MSVDTSPGYLTLSEIVQQINSYSHSIPRKVAISITGGGARGAYEAGVLEAIMQEFLKPSLPDPIKPDIITGASAGAIIASSLFVDLLYNVPRPPGSLFNSNQSETWRNFSNRNSGSVQIAGDRAMIIQYASSSRPLPVIGDLIAIKNELEQSKNAMVDDFEKFRQKLKSLGDVITSFDLDKSALKFDNTQKTLERSFNDLRHDAEIIKNKARVFEESNFTDLVEAASLVKAVFKFVGDLLMAIGKTVGALWTDLIELLTAFVKELSEYFSKVLSSLGETALAFGKLIWDGVALTGNALRLVGAIAKAVAALLIVIPITNIFMIEIGLGIFKIPDHMIKNNNLFNIIENYKLTSFRNSGRPRPPDQDTKSLIVDDWLLRNLQSETLPELFLTSTNLTEGASRLTVLSVAKEGTIQLFDKQAIWIVDLTRKTKQTENVFHSEFDPDEREHPDPFVKATVTSASLPVIFPPIKWRISRMFNRNIQNFQHVFTDGGVLDNTPIDLAVIAGATHIISIELTPLIEDISNNDNFKYNMANIYFRSFDVARRGTLIGQVNTIAARNTIRKPEERIQIYRIAPLMPVKKQSVKQSVDTIDFDGAFDDNNNLIMSLFDWFMQGYIDAIGGNNLSNSNVFQDYINGPPNRGDRKNARDFNNKFWRGTIEAWPDNTP
jgi:predicted acylesterase/phospholipase RssA